MGLLCDAYTPASTDHRVERESAHPPNGVGSLGRRENRKLLNDISGLPRLFLDYISDLVYRILNLVQLRFWS